MASEVLLKVPNVECYKLVQGGGQTLLTRDVLSIELVEDGEGGDAGVARLGTHVWPLTDDTPTLKASQRVFVLTAPGLGYVSLVLPADAPPEAADALEAVLEGLTAYGSAATGAAESAYGAAASAPPMAADQPGPSYTATQEFAYVQAAATPSPYQHYPPVPPPAVGVPVGAPPPAAPASYGAAFGAPPPYAPPVPLYGQPAAPYGQPVMQYGQPAPMAAAPYYQPPPPAPYAQPPPSYGLYDAASAPPAPYGALVPAAGAAAGSRAVVPAGGRPAASDKWVANLQKGSEVVGMGIMQAAAVAGAGILKGADYAIANTQPAAKPVVLSQTTMQRLATAKGVAGVAAKGTMKVAAGVGALLGTVASAVADKVVAAPSVQQAIRKNPGKADAVAKVGRAGVQALEGVFEAMEAASRYLVASTGQATTKYVHHKYGPQAAAVSQEAVKVVGECVIAAAALRSMTMRAMLRRTAGKTAKRITAATMANRRAAGAAGAAGVAGAGAFS